MEKYKSKLHKQASNLPNEIKDHICNEYIRGFQSQVTIARDSSKKFGVTIRPEVIRFVVIGRGIELKSKKELQMIAMAEKARAK